MHHRDCALFCARSLSNGDAVCCRYGFVEPVRTEGGALRRLAAASSAMETAHRGVQDPPPASGAAHLWRPPNPHDCAVAPLEAVLQMSLLRPQDGTMRTPRSQLLQDKLQFMQEFRISPRSQRCAPLLPARRNLCSCALQLPFGR